VSWRKALIELRVLGRAELRDGDRGELDSILTQPKRLAILTYLCLGGRGGFVRRDELIALFWPESDTERARAALNQSLYILRRALGADVIPGRGAEEVRVAATELTCDAARFLDRLEEGDLSGALDLYGGDLLPALYVDSAEADRWLDETRIDLRGRALQAAKELATEAMARGDVDPASQWYRRALDIGPESESAARGVVESLWRGGHRTAALEAFEQFKMRLSSEYGVEPGAELQELVQQVRRGGQVRSDERVPKVSEGVVPDETPARNDGNGNRVLQRGPRLAAALFVVAAVVSVAAVVAGRFDRTLRVAVLPFDASGVELPDTLHAELLFYEVTKRLAGSGAHVISPVATDQYAGFEDPVSSLKEELDVDVVWVTHWERDGPSARAQAELIDTQSMVSLASTTIAVPPDWLDRVVPRLTKWAAEELDLTLAEARYEPDPEARKIYLKAQMAWWREEYEGILELAEEATLLDPEYADAFALYSMILLQHTHLPAERICDLYDALVPPAMEAARRALELDSTLVTPHVTLGHALWEHELDVEGGRREFEMALRLDPDDPDANIFYGWFLIVNGRPREGLRYLDRASEAYQLRWRYHHLRSIAYGYLGSEEQAKEPYFRMLAARVGLDSWAGYALRDFLLRQGRVEEAIELTVEMGSDTTARPLDERFQFALALGNTAAVDRIIERNLAAGELRLASLRSYHAGYHEQALGLLEQWWETLRGCRTRMQMWLLADFPELIGEPRFQAMADEVGIPWRDSELWAEMSD
jgi:serine/threonine-protein kinase